MEFIRIICTLPVIVVHITTVADRLPAVRVNREISFSVSINNELAFPYITDISGGNHDFPAVLASDPSDHRKNPWR